MRWAALDFETATRSQSSACALGLVIVDDGVEVARQAWLIRPPGNAYDMGNVAVHGIRPCDTEHAPEFPDVWGEAMFMIGDRPLVAHNAPFDVGVVRRACAELGGTLPELRYFCTVQLARRTWPQLGAWRLPVVAEHVGAQLDHHDALSDAAAASSVMSACIREAEATCVASLAERHRLPERWVHVPLKRSASSSPTHLP